MAFSRDRSYPSGSQSLSNRSMVALAVVVMLASGLAYLGFAAHPGSAQEESNPRTRSGAGFGLGGLGLPADRDKVYQPDQNYIQLPLPLQDGKYASIKAANIEKYQSDIIAIAE